MAKTSIAIPDELLEKAKIEAVKRKISFAELVREQLERYFEERGRVNEYEKRCIDG